MSLRRFPTSIACFTWLLVLACGPTVCTPAAAQVNPERFRASIEEFLKSDAATPPPRNAILFIGSSIFRQWTSLREQMTPLPVFNRAFGGSQTHEILYYMDRIVLPYEPKIIVYYCGSNDINAGAEPAGIADRFRQFVLRVHAKLPGTRIFYVSINRAPQKENRWDRVDAANSSIRAFCEGDRRLGYIDVNPALFDASGKPRLELYLDDKLHFRPPAYVLFTEIIKPVLERAWQEP